MANNVTAKDAGGSDVTFKSTDNAGVHTTHVNVDANALPTGASTAANQSTALTRVGDVTETAPGTDTASSGLNGRLQRVAQRLTSLIALLPSSLGQKASAASLAVVLASDQSPLTSQGAVASGATASGNPVPVGGKDGSGNRQELLTDTDGTAHVLNVGALNSTDDKVDVEKVGGAAVATADYDSGAGTATRAAFGIIVPGSGGPVFIDGDANGLKVQQGAALPAGTNNIGDVDVATQPVRARTTDTMSSALATDALMVGTTALTPKFAAIAASSSGDNQVVAAVASKKIRVLNYTLVANAAVNAKWRSATTDKTGLLYLGAQGHGASPAFSPAGHFETASGEALNLNLSGAVAVGGHVTYVEV